jgi:Kef-type K+ transport system membrane component KefB
MEFIELLTMLVTITLVSKVIAKLTKTVDILWYIILGLIGTQYVYHIESGTLENWSTLGVIFIMFYAGWKEDLADFLSGIWRNKWVALLGALGPFIGALGIFKLLGFTTQESVVAGFIFTSSAVPYTIAILNNLGLEDTPAAKTIMSSTVTDNFISIILAIGVLPAYALLHAGVGGGQGDLMVIGLELLRQVGLIIGAFVIFAFLGLFILPDSSMKMRFAVPDALQRNGLLSRIVFWAYKLRKSPGFYDINQKLMSMKIGVPLTLILIFGLSLLAHHLGLHPAIAAYMTGLILNDSMYRNSEEQSELQEKTGMTHKNLSVFFYFVQEWIGPIFFIYLGSQLVADWSRAGFVVIVAFVCAVVIGLFQFFSTYSAGSHTKLVKKDSILLALGMFPRDVVSFVVLGIATTVGLVHPDSMFVITVIVTILILNILTSLLLFWYKPIYEEEK